MVIGESSSDWRNVTSCVPAGILSFVIFINDMPLVVKHFIKLFADDSKLIGVIKNRNNLQIFQYDLDTLVNWVKKWRMLFHPDKCKVMEITRAKEKNVCRLTIIMEKTE